MFVKRNYPQRHPIKFIFGRDDSKLLYSLESLFICQYRFSKPFSMDHRCFRNSKSIRFDRYHLNLGFL